MISPSHRKKAVMRPSGAALWLLLAASFLIMDIIAASVIINEVNIDNPGKENCEFVELYNTNQTSAVMLTNYVLVFYDGSTGKAYEVIPLGDREILAGGYFVVGSSTLNPDLNLTKSEHNIQNGPDGMALYLTKGDSTHLQSGMNVTVTGLIDAIVYDTRGRNVTTLLNGLAPGQNILQEDWYGLPQQDESLSKCGNQRNQPLLWSAFQLTVPTPGEENDCPSSSDVPAGFLVISEFNADNPMTDTAEFIELYHVNGTIKMTGFVLALYSHNLKAYFVLDLSNYSTNAQGYFVIGKGDIPNLGYTLPSDVVIQNGQDAIVLYKGNPEDYSKDMAVTTVGLVQALVYDHKKSGESGLTRAFGVQVVHFEDPHFMTGDESVSRCDGDLYKLTPPTPGVQNNCSYIPPVMPHVPTTPAPSTPSVIVINELNADNPSTENKEYIELYDGGRGETSLSGYQVVLYDSSGLSYKVWNLTGSMTSEAGYFVIGGTGVTPKPDLVFGGSHVIRNNGGAVALYGSGTARIGLRVNITSRGLVDALVYTIRDPAYQTPALQLLKDGQKAFVENATHMVGEESVSRCYGMATLLTTPYRLTPPTPGQENQCPLPSNIVINELNPDQRGMDKFEFVELFDGGKGNTSLDGLSLVFINGYSDAAYGGVDLSGNATNEEGYFVVGSPQVPNASVVLPNNFLQNGADAVALYLAPLTRYGFQAAATANNLVDAIVYGTSNQNVDPGLIRTLVKGDRQVLDAVPKSLSVEDVSVSRCSCCSQRDTAVWGVARPTPGRSNEECIRTNETVVDSLVHLQDDLRITELRVAEDGESDGSFIELYDGGHGNVSLQGLLLILFAANNMSYSVFDLDTYNTNANGYFVIGSENIPNADLTNVTGNWLQKGPNAVSLNRGTKGQFTKVSKTGKIDAIVYAKSDKEAGNVSYLIDMLAPHEDAVIANWGPSSGIKSIVRCYSNLAAKLRGFGLSTNATAGKANICPPPPVVINEVAIDQKGQDLLEYIELRTVGEKFFPINGVVLVLYSATTMKAYRALKLDNRYSGPREFYLIGSQDVSNRLYATPDIVIDGGSGGFLRNTPGALALYFNRGLNDFRAGADISTEGLFDAVVYGSGTPTENVQQLLRKLTPGKSMVENRPGDESISRCPYKSSPGEFIFVSSQLTPKSKNNCSLAPTRPVTPVMPGVRINEVNTDFPGTDVKQYIELAGDPSSSLEGVTIVVYSDQNANKATYIQDLTGQRINAEGFLLIGNPAIKKVDIPQPEKFLRIGGLNAVVMYKLNASAFVKDQTQAFRNGSLIDFIIYGNTSTYSPDTNSLLDIFATGQKQLDENDHNIDHDESISRCSPDQVGDMMAFTVTIPTPGTQNNCTISTILINEINADSPGQDNKEFIELSDGGHGNTPLNWIVLVLYNGANGNAYLTLDLTNKRTDALGFYLIGGADVANVDYVLSQSGVSIIQNGPDAVALHKGHSANYTTGMSPTKEGLIDAVVYGRNDAQNQVLLNALLPSGQKQINENPSFLSGDESISRCKCNDQLQTQCFTLSNPTPKTKNNCTETTSLPTTVQSITTVAIPTGDLPKVVINEVNVDQPGLDKTEFIELAGPSNASLAWYSLVLFSYSTVLKRAHVSIALNLNNYRIGNSGLFLISNHTKFPVKTDYVLPVPGIIENGIEAIVLYDNRQGVVSDNMQPTQQGAMDAVVHCTSAWDRDLGNYLITTLGLKGTGAIVEDAVFHVNDESINRCGSNETMDLTNFKLSIVTPGGPNVCPQIQYARPVQLKLINADCREWRQNDTLLLIFKENIAFSVNEKCNCGFSADYITDLQVHCGVVLVFNIIGTSEDHIKKIHTSYLKYMNGSKTIKLAGHHYSVDACIENKCYIQPSGQTGEPEGGSQLGVSIGVGLGCVAALIVVIVVTVICIKKRRSGTLQFQMARFDDADDDLDDEWVGGAPASFNNPLYSKILS